MGMKSLDSKSTATTRPAGSKSQLEAWPSRFLTSRNSLGNVRRNESTKSSAFVGLNKVLAHILRWAFSGCQEDLPAGGSPAMRCKIARKSTIESRAPWASPAARALTKRPAARCDTCTHFRSSVEETSTIARDRGTSNRFAHPSFKTSYQRALSIAASCSALLFVVLLNTKVSDKNPLASATANTALRPPNLDRA